MTEPTDPHSVDLGAIFGVQVEAGKAMQHAYWESPEVAALADRAAAAVIARGLAIVNGPGDPNSQFKMHLFQTENELGFLSPSEGFPPETMDMLLHPVGADMYHERVSKGILDALEHTIAVPMEGETFPTTVRVGWNESGRAFILREELSVVDTRSVDPKDFGAFTGHIGLNDWKYPDLIIDRIVADHHGFDQERVLKAIMAIAPGHKHQKSMFDAARKALRDMRKLEKKDPNYATWGPGSERAPHAPLSAAIFDKANLEKLDAERAAKPRGLGRLAFKRRSRTLTDTTNLVD